MKKTALIPLTSCTRCENFSSQPIPCSDSFCRPEKWFCKHEDVDQENNTIDGYHDMTDKDPGIPNFRPFIPEDQKDEEPEYEEVTFTRDQIDEWMTGQLDLMDLELISQEGFVDEEGKFASLVCKCKKV